MKFHKAYETNFIAIYMTWGWWLQFSTKRWNGWIHQSPKLRKKNSIFFTPRI